MAKPVMVPEDKILQYYRIKALQTPPEAFELSELDQKMSNILGRTDLSPKDKAFLYYKNLTKFQNLFSDVKRKQQQIPTASPDEKTKTTDPVKDISLSIFDSDNDNDELTTPSRKRKKIFKEESTEISPADSFKSIASADDYKDENKEEEEEEEEDEEDTIENLSSKISETLFENEKRLEEDSSKKKILYKDKVIANNKEWNKVIQFLISPTKLKKSILYSQSASTQKKFRIDKLLEKLSRFIYAFKLKELFDLKNTPNYDLIKNKEIKKLSPRRTLPHLRKTKTSPIWANIAKKKVEGIKKLPSPTKPKTRATAAAAAKIDKKGSGGIISIDFENWNQTVNNDE